MHVGEPRRRHEILMTMIQLLKTIVRLLSEICEILKQNQKRNLQFEDNTIKLQQRFTRQEAMDKLKITKSTYTRWRKAGILRPENPQGRHSYTEADLERALQESRRKGNI